MYTPYKSPTQKALVLCVHLKRKAEQKRAAPPARRAHAHRNEDHAGSPASTSTRTPGDPSIMQSGKSYAAAAARKPHAAGTKANSGSNGNATNSKPASTTSNNKKKNGGESKGKPNGKDTVAAAPPAPPGFAAPKQPSVGFSDQQQRVLRHRALFAFRFFVGKAVEVELDDKSLYAGVLDCIDPDDFSIVLKNTQGKSEGGDEAFQSGSTVIFKRRQIVHLTVDGVVNYNEGAFGATGAAGTASASAVAAGEFRTDTEISGRQHDHLFGRELQAASSWLDPQLDSGELEDPRRRSSKSGWNQFEANEKLFGVVSSFDENIYTTKLDKTKISNQQSRDAERIAFEIERQTSSNFHLQEERGQQSAQGQQDDLDEEARYSSVDRKHHSKASSHAAHTPKNSNSYVPPAMRNQQQRQTSGERKTQTKADNSQPKQQQVAAPANTAAPAAAPASAPAPASTPSAPKPLSFSDAVMGRTAAKPEQKKTAAPAASVATTSSPNKSAPGPVAATNGTDAKRADSKPAATPAPAATASTSTSPKKKSSASEPKESSSKATSAKEAKSKTDSSSPGKKAAKAAAAAPAAAPSSAATATTTTTTTSASASTTTSSAAAAAKKTLNPNAKEFKLNVSAVEFTPKFTVPAVPAAAATVASPVATMASPYRGPASHHHQPHHHQHHHQQQHHPQQQHMGGHMHHQPHPAMGMYSPMPEEWMYEGVVGMDEAELMQQGGYMAYGVPMVPGVPVMQPQGYPQMIPQQNMRMMGHGGGQRGPHGGYGGYQQPPYNPRAYYPPAGGVPGGMPYPGAVPVGVAPQPPLPREPTPTEAPPAAAAAAAAPSPSSPQSSAKPPSFSAAGGTKK